MEFIFNFHLKTQKDDLLLELVQKCSGINQASRVKYVDDLQDNILTDREAYPDYLSFSRNCTEWFTVECNSFKKLHDWGALLSKELETLFLQTVYSSVNEYSYLLAYENGEMIREIEATNHSETPVIDKGRPFEFEKESERMFDLDSLMDFCTYLGIDTINGSSAAYFVVMKDTAGRSCPVMYNIQRELVKAMNEIEKRTRLTALKKDQ